MTELGRANRANKSVSHAQAGCYTAAMGQAMELGNRAAGRRAYVAGAELDAILARELTDAGWTLRACVGPAEEGGTTLTLIDLRGGYPSGRDPLVRMRSAVVLAILARDRGVTAREAVLAGATHLAIDPAPGDLAAIADAAWRHAERSAPEGQAKTTAPGWPDPEEAITAIQQRLSGSSQTSMAMMIAMERLDIVNAAYGRRVGDQLLLMAATRIERTGHESGQSWAISRVGGSEFVVLMDASDAAATAAELIDRGLSPPFAVAGLSVSVGHRVAVTVPEVGESGASLVERLRGLVRAAGADLDGFGPEDAATLAVDLHRAIERDEIEMLFQPQVCLRGGRIVGVEALARWEHPVLGTLGAEPLFAAAGQAGLAEVLSAHVQTLALRYAAGWNGALGALRIAINVTAQDIASPAFAATFLERLNASGFSAARLTIEITETGLIADLDGAAAVLARLQQAGCRVALDDFGTGYSSLAYLKGLPVDYLKIDKAITCDVTGSDRDRAVLAGVIGIARALGIATIAEGVETTDQRDRLEAMGCDLYQGFLCAEPIDGAELALLVSQ